MFGLSWGQIGIIAVIAMFLLGPERIPVAIAWVSRSLQTMRGWASGARSQLGEQFGSELAELREQIAELQSLKESLDLRDLQPARILSRMGEDSPQVAKSSRLSQSPPASERLSKSAEASAMSASHRDSRA
jgi:sec-independent protein translocase protein TatB